LKHVHLTTPEPIASLVAGNIKGSATMLNLICIRDIADYSDYPELATAADRVARDGFFFRMA
jgi:hypothetical protein